MKRLDAGYAKPTTVVLAQAQLDALEALFPFVSMADQVRIAIDGYLLFRTAGFVIVETRRTRLLDREREA